MNLQIKSLALASVAQLEHPSIDQRVTGLIPHQGTGPAVGSNPGQGP